MIPEMRKKLGAKDRQKLKDLIRKHVTAQVAKSWAGSFTPEESETAKSEADKVSRELYAFIGSI